MSMETLSDVLPPETAESGAAREAAAAGARSPGAVFDAFGLQGSLWRPPLWTALGAVGPLEARVSGGLPSEIQGISIDTRSLELGDLFFAIKGERSDGHDHVAAALEKGAAAAVVDEAHAEALKGFGPLYVVHEVLP